MPDCYKDSVSITTSYRNYYIGDKKAMANYTVRAKPHWL